MFQVGGASDGDDGASLLSMAMSLPLSYWQSTTTPAPTHPMIGSLWGRRGGRSGHGRGSFGGISGDRTDGNISMGRGAGERRHTCKVCGKAFKLKHHLVEHDVVHRAEKPFCCPACPATFKRAKQVKYHMRLHHRALLMEYETSSSDPTQQSDNAPHSAT